MFTKCQVSRGSLIGVTFLASGKPGTTMYYLLLVIYYFIIFLMCIHLYIAINVQYCSVAVSRLRYYYTLLPT